MLLTLHGKRYSIALINQGLTSYITHNYKLQWKQGKAQKTADRMRGLTQKITTHGSVALLQPFYNKQVDGM
jgi:hypothetical protein